MKLKELRLIISAIPTDWDGYAVRVKTLSFSDAGLDVLGAVRLQQQNKARGKECRAPFVELLTDREEEYRRKEIARAGILMQKGEEK
jgi:hypothetical protein